MNNWEQESNIKAIFFKDGFDEKVYRSEIGKQEVTRICEHRAQGEGDKWHYDIYKGEWLVNRVFNIVSAEYKIKA